MRDGGLPDIHRPVAVDVRAVDAEAVRADPLGPWVGLLVASVARGRQIRVAGTERVETVRLRNVREVAGAVVFPEHAPSEADRHAVM